MNPELGADSSDFPGFPEGPLRLGGRLPAIRAGTHAALTEPARRQSALLVKNMPYKDNESRS